MIESTSIDSAHDGLRIITLCRKSIISLQKQITRCDVRMLVQIFLCLLHQVSGTVLVLCTAVTA